MTELALILSDIRSTYNVGSILRSGDCFGVKHIYFAGYTPYPRFNGDTRLPHLANKITRAIHKTALGAETTLPFSLYDNVQKAVADVKKQGYIIAALEQSPASQSLYNYQPPAKLALILGNETDGISMQTLRQSDVILEIPMFGKKESLNVSISAAVALYALRFHQGAS